MSTTDPTKLAMTIAGIMIAHHVAAKAVRDATFLGAWDATNLPAMVFGTAIVAIAAVPVYARLLARFSPRRIVPVAFAASAAAHLIEWRVSGGNPWIAVLIYLHIAAFGALLHSGFWSVISELFDPKAAKASYGRIAAGGTLGGLLGGLSAGQIATTMPEGSALLFLAGLHLMCAAGVSWLGRTPALFTDTADPAIAPGPMFELKAIGASPHLRTLALMVVLGTAAAAIVDFLLKSGARERIGTGPELLQFFAWFYTVIQIVTFLAQAGVGHSLNRIGVGRTMAMLPLGLGATGAMALVYQVFPSLVVLRGAESVLRGSVFRGGYELMFVPMPPDEKRRTKTFLDVTCDRAGDAVGALIVQVALLTGFAVASRQLLAIVIVMAAIGAWLARRLDATYVRVVENELRRQGGDAPLLLPSETGWTVIERSPSTAAAHPPRPKVEVAGGPPRREEDPKLRILADLRSGDRRRVDAALRRLSNPDRGQVAQVIQLLAWDDMVAGARQVLETVAGNHVGLLIDELLDPDTDFAIRRRIPRILGTLSSDRALDGLVEGLNDPRFEVRYQCGRAIDRLVSKNPGLTVDANRILAVVEQELSVTPQVWYGHRLIDRDEDASAADGGPHRAQQSLEHLFALLAAVLPREPLQVALRGISSDNPGLRGLAVEYLDSVLPQAIRSKLWHLLDATVEDKSE